MGSTPSKPKPLKDQAREAFETGGNTLLNWLNTQIAASTPIETLHPALNDLPLWDPARPRNATLAKLAPSLPTDCHSPLIDALTPLFLHHDRKKRGLECSALAMLVPHLPTDTLTTLIAALTPQLHLHDHQVRVNACFALAKLAPHLSTDSQTILLAALTPLLPRSTDWIRAPAFDTLDDLVPHLSADNLKKTLTIASFLTKHYISSTRSRATHIASKIATYDVKLVPQALSTIILDGDNLRTVTNSLEPEEMHQEQLFDYCFNSPIAAYTTAVFYAHRAKLDVCSEPDETALNLFTEFVQLSLWVKLPHMREVAQNAIQTFCETIPVSDKPQAMSARSEVLDVLRLAEYAANTNEAKAWAKTLLHDIRALWEDPHIPPDCGELEAADAPSVAVSPAAPPMPLSTLPTLSTSRVSLLPPPPSAGAGAGVSACAGAGVGADAGAPAVPTPAIPVPQENDLALALRLSLVEFEEDQAKRAAAAENTQLFSLEPVDADYEEGNCLFVAVSVGLRSKPPCAQVRECAIKYMRSNKQILNHIRALANSAESIKLRTKSPPDKQVRSVGHYLELMSQDRTWGTQLEIIALSRVYQRPIVVITPYNQYDQIIDAPEFATKAPIFLNYINDNHFVPLSPPPDANPMDILQDIRDTIESRHTDHAATP